MANRSIDGNFLTINGQIFERGIGTHSSAMFVIELDGKAKRFKAFVGLGDDFGMLQATHAPGSRSKKRFLISAEGSWTALIAATIRGAA